MGSRPWMRTRGRPEGASPCSITISRCSPMTATFLLSTIEVAAEAVGVKAFTGGEGS